MSDVDVVFGMDTEQAMTVVSARNVICIEIEMLGMDQTVVLKNLQSSTFILETKEKWLVKSSE
jgi:hypothetical protein